MRVHLSRHWSASFKTGALSLALLLPVLFSSAQGDALPSLRSNWDAWHSRALQEKIFVHTDKPHYLAGELLWCKLYCVDAALHTPLDISKVAYVDLLDKDDHAILQGKISMEKGEGEGSFSLPLTLGSGNYRLRAYTNWMKNFGPEVFFEQSISVFNTLKDFQAPGTASPIPGSQSTEISKSLHTIALFPEGGNLVRDIPSKIGFRITGPDGKGVAAKGMVIDERQDTVATFQPLRYGIGSFVMTPGDHTYKVVVRFPDGETVVMPFPKVYAQGIVLKLEPEGEGQLKLTVHSRGSFSRKIYLLALSGPSLRLALQGELSQDSAVFRIGRDSLLEGITQLTLFDGDLRPICERLYFKRPARQLSIDVRSDKVSYATRGKVQLSLSSGLSGDGPSGDRPASLSLSVYRVDSLQSGAAPDIYHYLWLSSDLKGFVEAPETYFTATGPEEDEARDNLMLTHGWRRFRWENILQGKGTAFPYPPEFKGHFITGRLTDARTGQPLRDRLGYLSVPGTNFLFHAAATDATGKLFFDVKIFFGQAGMVLHSGTEEDSVCKVEIFSPFSEQYTSSRLPLFNLSDAQQRSSLVDRSIGMQVQNIFVGDSLRKFGAPSIDTMHFFGTPDYTYLLDNYVRFTTMEEVLREYVREIGVNRPHGKLHALMLDEPLRAFFEGNNTLVLLDGVPVPDDKIFSYDPLKVKKLEIIPRLYFMGPAVFSGIASFTTYNGDYEGLELDRHSLLIDYEGLQFQREFYAPEYASEAQLASRLPDFRDLLYWSPDLHFDDHGKKELGFYTSDVPGKYRVVVQGLATDGRAGGKVMEFEVR